MGKYNWSDEQNKRREDRRPKPKKASEKLAKANRDYSKASTLFLINHPTCEAILPGCTKRATEVHHKKGRGKWLLIVKLFLAVCHNCHRYIETHPAEAKEKGFSLKRNE